MKTQIRWLTGGVVLYAVITVNSVGLKSEPATAKPQKNAAPQTPPAPGVPRASAYYFDGTISRAVLENYLARPISVEGVFNGRGDLDDNIRMLKSLGVKYAGIIYPLGQRRAMGNAQVPDASRLETQLWFYYQAASCIDLGFEAIHFGQVEIMNRIDRDNAQWDHLLTRVRAYAARHARRHIVLCNGHTPTGGLVHDGRLLLDFHAFPLRIKENPNKAQDAILQVTFFRRHLRA